MKAILIKEYGDANQLTMGEYETPKLQPKHLLIKIKAASLNRADILQREGKYPPPPGASPLLGLDCAGIVKEVDHPQSPWKKGDRVMALLSGGGYAEYVSIPQELAMPIPSDTSFEEAAAIPEVFLTAYQCLFWIGGIKKNDDVLIHAGASGVGTAAIQLAKAARASSIYVTCGSDEKAQACLKLGATSAINYNKDSFEEVIFKKNNKKGVKLILDFIGAPYWEGNLKTLGMDGKLVLIAAMGGLKTEKLNLLPFLLKRIQVTGTTLRSRREKYKYRLTKVFSDFAMPLFNKGRLKPVIDKVFSWNDVTQAHQYMESNKNFGKIILKMD